MGSKPAGGGGQPIQRYQPAQPEAAPERKKKPGTRTASMYAGAITEQRQEQMAQVARKQLLGQ